MKYSQLSNYTHYSLQYGFSKPKELVNSCLENGYTACGIADYNTLSGCVDFFEKCVKKNIKPVLGFSTDNAKYFALNKNGWFDLIQITSNNDFEPLKCGNIACLTKAENEYTKLVPKNRLFEFTGKESFYNKSEDSELQRICLASKLKTTLSQIASSKEYNLYKHFFSSSNYNFGYEATDSEKRIVDLCEEYSILEKPQLPKYQTPNGETEDEYLKNLCRHGWVNNLIKLGKIKTEEDKNKYLDRFNYEFKVLVEANLCGYFLIVWDIINFVKSNNWLQGAGRGSCGGCLISYLMGITLIDPLEFGLIFERFYNPGRNTKDHVSLPDIDIDVPSDKREHVIAYIKQKYGKEKVSQMITHGRLQGRSSVKEVLRINNACGFNEMNNITNSIPDEAAISDQLENMDEDERGIIKWSLINKADELRPYCTLNDDGTLTGDYAPYFDLAIRLEGTFKNRGKHAAGVIISKHDLGTVCPMIGEGDNKIANLEMGDLESLGHVKFDILGVNVLSKLMLIEELNVKQKRS